VPLLALLDTFFLSTYQYNRPLPSLSRGLDEEGVPKGEFFEVFLSKWCNSIDINVLWLIKPWGP
jgi:hypothetical protein